MMTFGVDEASNNCNSADLTTLTKAVSSRWELEDLAGANQL